MRVARMYLACAVTTSLLWGAGCDVNVSNDADPRVTRDTSEPAEPNRDDASSEREPSGPRVEAPEPTASASSGAVYVLGNTEGAVIGEHAGGIDIFVRLVDAGGSRVYGRQLGSADDDRARAMGVGSTGTVALVGETSGDLFGASRGTLDAFVTVYDISGNLLFRRQFGTEGEDSVSDVRVADDGTVVVVGTTTGALSGTSAGGKDVFVRAYSADGVPLYTRQFGSAGDDTVDGLALGADGSVALGGTAGEDLAGTSNGRSDAYLWVYESDATVRFVRQFGSDGDELVADLVYDGTGNLILAGTTDGVMAGGASGQLDAFVVSYASTGTRNFTKQFGTPLDDIVVALSAAPGVGFAVVGDTEGSLAGPGRGGSDAFVRVYDGSGSTVLGKQIGSSAEESATDVALDADGNLYVTGTTTGAIVGGQSRGTDLFVRKFSASGETVFSRQFGSAGEETGALLTLDADGQAFTLTGSSDGTVASRGSGGTDVIMRRYDAEGETVYTVQDGSSEADSVVAVGSY